DPGSVSTTGHARLFFQPFTDSRSVSVGHDSDQPGRLSFTRADGAAVAQGASGFSHVTIGRPDGTGQVALAAGGMTFDTNVTLESSGTDSFGVDVSGNGILDVGTNHDLTLLGGPVTLVEMQVLTHGGKLSIIGSGATSHTFGIAIQYATLDAGGGDVSLSGTGADGTVQAYGINATRAVVQTSGGGKGTLEGTGGDGTTQNPGVLLSDMQVKSVDGDLSIIGAGQGSGNSAYGLDVEGGAVEATGSGKVTLLGNGGNGSSFSTGVVLS